MKKRLIALSMILALLFSLCINISGLGNSTTAYNSGTRHVVCTSLSSDAISYYTIGYDYDTLSQQSSSQLLQSLRTLMKSTHKYNSTYNDCKYLADQVDSTAGDGKINLLYTSKYTVEDKLGSSGAVWNREHVWPKSLGGFETSGAGADLHHIRPADANVNGRRSNNKYGNVNNGTAVYGSALVDGALGGWYGGGYFEPLDNVKGDVARICLYIYVRYGAEINECGSITNVFQSVDVLLEWCELDPVDEWEMGRNDVVEEIQGNRNVFIDYPEYAWMIFAGEEVPEDMTTPSGEAQGTSGSQGGTTNPPTGGSQGGTTNPPTGGEEGGTTPPAGETGSTLIDAGITNSMPSELTYITNNTSYPDPSFYSAGGLKMNFANMGVQTSAFAAQSSVRVTINVNALNENTKSDTGADVFTVYGLDAGGNVVATATYDDVAVGENVVVLNGEGIVSVKVIMTNYAHNGNSFCNIGLAGIKVEALTESGEQGGTTNPPTGGEEGGTTNPPTGGEEGGTTPPTGETGSTLIDAGITNSMPSELTYITNNTSFPDPSFYSAGGLKMNFVNMGVQTSAFAAQNSVKVIINVNALNENTKSGTDADVFTVYGLDAGGNVVATATYDAVVVGENVVVLNGEGIVSVKVIMTDYAHNGNSFCNIGLGGIKVEGLAAGGTTNPPAGGEEGGTTNPPTGEEEGGTTTPPTGGEESGTTAPTPGTTAPTPSDDADCAHSFSEWVDIGNGMRMRTCVLCDASEASVNKTEEPAEKGCNAVLGSVSVVVLPVALLGFALVARKKEREI